jgi:hypothetical protein
MPIEGAVKAYAGLSVDEDGEGWWSVTVSSGSLEIGVTERILLRVYLLVCLTVALVLAVLLAVKPPVWILIGGPLGVLLMGLAIIAIFRRTAAAGPWLVIDQKAGTLLLPILGKTFALRDCRFEVQRAMEDCGDSYCEVSTLYLITDQAAYIIVKSCGDRVVRRVLGQLEELISKPS